jgi:hypothetical protein
MLKGFSTLGISALAVSIAATGTAGGRAASGTGVLAGAEANHWFAQRVSVATSGKLSGALCGAPEGWGLSPVFVGVGMILSDLDII